MVSSVRRVVVVKERDGTNRNTTAVHRILGEPFFGKNNPQKWRRKPHAWGAGDPRPRGFQ